MAVCFPIISVVNAFSVVDLLQRIHFAKQRKFVLDSTGGAREI